MAEIDEPTGGDGTTSPNVDVDATSASEQGRTPAVTNVQSSIKLGRSSSRTSEQAAVQASAAQENAVSSSNQDEKAPAQAAAAGDSAQANLGVDSADARASTPPSVPAAPAGTQPRPFRKGGVTAGFQAVSELFAKKKKAREDIREDQERWLLRRDGTDYGPFDAPTVREKLEAEEVTEYTVIVDSFTGELCELVDAPYFADYVIDFIPRRNQKHREIEERRQELVQEVKKRSVRASFSVALGAIILAAIGLLGLHISGVLPFKDVIETISPTPKEFPFNQVVRNYRFHFEVPEPEYQSISADKNLVASLFAPPSKSKPRRQGKSGGSNDRFDTGDEEYMIDFDAGEGPERKLTQQEVNDTMGKYSHKIGACFQEEMRSNANFKGATLRFSINPNGKTFSVRASTTGGKLSSSAEGCLVRAVRSMRFPTFNDVPMSISYPFYVN